MSDTILGFTGSRHPLLEPQLLSLERLLRVLFGGGARKAVHGAATGADEAFALACRELMFEEIVARPGDLPQWVSAAALAASSVVHPAEANATRNGKIVGDCTVMIACPAAPEGAAESRRSGTWMSVRMARKAARPIWVVWPCGKVTKEGEV